MQSSRKVLVVSASLILGALFVAACVLLVLGLNDFRHEDAKLAAAKSRLQYLYNQDPFPSEYNLRMGRKNLADKDAQLAGLLQAVRDGQIESFEQSPAKFNSQFWTTHKQLRSKAAKEGVVIPSGADFGFGFERHMKGELPAAQDVPRLTQQLGIVQTVCGVLFDARISSLQGVGREEFEADVGAAAPSGPQRRKPAAQMSLNTPNVNAGLIPPDRLYGSWHFVLAFTAKERALLDVLNGLARCPMFVEVTDLNLASPEKGMGLTPDNPVEPPAKAGTAATRRIGAQKAGETEAAEENGGGIVCGHDLPLTVKMELDVYQFGKYQPSEAENKTGVPK